MRNVCKVILTASALCAAGSLARAGTLDKGKQVFDRWCASCHSPGARAPGTSALAAKYGTDEPAALEERKDLAPDVVKYFVRNGISMMPFFRKTEISDAELEALAGYLSHRSADPEK